MKSISQIRSLKYEQTVLNPPVELQVTVVSHLYSGFDAQDETGGIFFKSMDRLPLGSRLKITGNVTGGFYGPYIIPEHVESIGVSEMPAPLRWLPEFVETGAADNRWVEIEGLFADIATSKSKTTARGILITGSTDLGIRFISYDPGIDTEYLKSLKGARIRLKGTGAPLFNDAKQRIGAEIIASDLNAIKILSPPETQSLPVTPIEKLGQWDSRSTELKFTRTRGTITSIDNQQVVLQIGQHAAPVEVKSITNIEVGDYAEAIGIPKSFGYSSGLRFAELKSLPDPPPSWPTPVNDDSPMSKQHAWKLITIAGTLVESTGEYWTLKNKDQLIPVKKIPIPLKVGSQIKVTGVKTVDTTQRGEVRSLVIFPRSSADIELLTAAPWWTPARYLTAVLLLTATTATILAWTVVLRKQVQSQTRQIQNQIEQNAALEERNRIARELHDTLSQGFAGVGYQLKSVANHIGRDPQKARQKLATATRMVEHSLKETRLALTSLRRTNDAEPDLISVFQHTASELCQTASIEFQLDTNKTEIHLPQSQAHEVQRILLEAVSNAIKHGEPSLINARIDTETNSITASIEDNGRGFSISEIDHQQDRFGIQGMQERASQLPDGELTIDTTPGNGTCITLKFNPSITS